MTALRLAGDGWMIKREKVTTPSLMKVIAFIQLSYTALVPQLGPRGEALLSRARRSEVGIDCRFILL